MLKKQEQKKNKTMTPNKKRLPIYLLNLDYFYHLYIIPHNNIHKNIYHKNVLAFFVHEPNTNKNF